MELKINYNPETKILDVKEGISKQIDVYLNNLKKEMLTTFKMSTINGKEGLYKLIIKSKDLLDISEFMMLETLNMKGSPYIINSLEKLSKSFIDLHDNETRFESKFTNALKRLKEKIKPHFYIKKSKTFWWVGLTKGTKLNMKNKEIIREIYRIGCGLGLVPVDMTLQEKEEKLDNDYDDDVGEEDDDRADVESEDF